MATLTVHLWRTTTRMPISSYNSYIPTSAICTLWTNRNRSLQKIRTTNAKGISKGFVFCCDFNLTVAWNRCWHIVSLRKMKKCPLFIAFGTLFTQPKQTIFFFVQVERTERNSLYHYCVYCFHPQPISQREIKGNECNSYFFFFFYFFLCSYNANQYNSSRCQPENTKSDIVNIMSFEKWNGFFYHFIFATFAIEGEKENKQKIRLLNLLNTFFIVCDWCLTFK